jgi:8-oxo-dGTP diphosphatase
MTNSYNSLHSNKSFSVAVGAVIISEIENILLLNRNTEPLLWAPPGGRLKKGEKPYEAILRECVEEIGLIVKPIALCDIWSGKHKGEDTIAIFYLTKIIDGSIRMSTEHSEYKWFTMDEVNNLVSSSRALGPLTIYLNALQLKRKFNSDERLILC